MSVVQIEGPGQVTRPVSLTLMEADMSTGVACSRDRTVLFLCTPALWPCWPFLPVVRRTAAGEELGVVFDARTAQLTGRHATVYRCNLFLLPPTLDAFLALPREAFDSAEELADGGWRVD